MACTSIIRLFYLSLNYSGSIGPIMAGSIGAIILLSYHLGLDVKEFCDLDMNKRETFQAVKTLAPNLTAMIPTVSLSFPVIRVHLTATPLLLQVPSQCVIDPILSSEGHISRRIMPSLNRTARYPGKHSCFRLIGKMGKEAFLPHQVLF